eukprot:scaffold4406_cov112-Isochrysis_galbana.AAC.23
MVPGLRPHAPQASSSGRLSSLGRSRSTALNSFDSLFCRIRCILHHLASSSTAGTIILPHLMHWAGGAF